MSCGKVKYKLLLLLGILGIGDTVFVSFFVPKILNFGILLPAVVGMILTLYSVIKIMNPEYLIVKNRTMNKIFTYFVLLFTISFIGIVGLIIVNSRDESNTDIDYVLVLGAGLNSRNEPSGPLTVRLEKCIEYLKMHPEAKAIVSGGRGIDEEVSEAFAMKEYMVGRGIDHEKILLEDKSTSTFENIKYSKELIENISDASEKKVLVITNDFHLFRAKMLAKRNGLIAYGLPCSTPPYTLFNDYLREFFAVLKSFVMDI